MKQANSPLMEWVFFVCLARRVWRGCPRSCRTRQCSSNCPKPVPRPSWVICLKLFRRTRGCSLTSWRVRLRFFYKNWSRCQSLSMSPTNGEVLAPSMARAHRRAAAVTLLPLDSCLTLRISLVSVIRGCPLSMTDRTTIPQHRTIRRSWPQSTSRCTPIRQRLELHHLWDRCQPQRCLSHHRGGLSVFFS